MLKKVCSDFFGKINSEVVIFFGYKIIMNFCRIPPSLIFVSGVPGIMSNLDKINVNPFKGNSYVKLYFREG